LLKEPIKFWLIYFCVALFSSIIIYFTPLFNSLAIRRIEFPFGPIAYFFSSYRIWSMEIWGMSMLAFSEVQKKYHHVFGIHNLFNSFILFAATLSMSDWIWTLDHNLRWRILQPDPTWLILQPGNEGHMITFVVVIVIGLIWMIGWMHNKKGIFSVRSLLIGIGLFWIWHIIKLLLVPSPAYTDWGYLTMVHPALMQTHPVLLIFIMNDVLDRMFFILIMIYALWPKGEQK
jgi:hypothetical protein